MRAKPGVLYSSDEGVDSAVVLYTGFTHTVYTYIYIYIRYMILMLLLNVALLSICLYLYVNHI